MSFRFSRSVYRNRLRLKTLLLTYERLELRQMLAGDSGLAPDVPGGLDQDSAIVAPKGGKTFEDRLAGLTPTYSYLVDGQPVNLVIHPARIALSLVGGASAEGTDLSSLGLHFQRKLNDQYSVFESIDNATIDTNQLINSGMVQQTVPVFFAQETRSEAVLLNEIIVALKPGVSAAQFFTNNLDFTGYEPLLGTPDQFIGKVSVGTGPDALALVNRLQGNASLDWVAPNFYQNWQKYFIPNDPRFPNQWHLNNTGQGGGLVDADDDLPEAWDVIPGGSSSYVIGVIDDGVSINHPDIAPWVNPGEVADGQDNDGNGWVDDINGWNFVSNNNNSAHTTASDAHGTAVAGVAAARGNNGIGVAGASYNSKVISARMFEGSAVASDANIAGALYYMAGRTADGLGKWTSSDVVNNSWGGGANSAAINAALTWGTVQGRNGLGVPYLFATGNGFGAVSQPALQSLNIPGVFAIGAANNLGTRSDYSNFGPAVDMVTHSNDTRPGYLAIDTTDRIGADGYDPSDYTGTGANGFGGTSSATPLASGITALTMARADALGVVMTPAELRSYLRTNTDLIGGAVYDISTGKNLEYGYGRLNAFSAVSNLAKPEISVVSTTTEIFVGDTYNMGSAFIDEFADATLRIRNQGTLPLNLSTVTLSAGPITLLTGFGSGILNLGEATTFSVRFAPTAGGVFNQLLTISSNDANEAAFSFTITAIAIAPSISGVVFEDWDGDNLYEAPDRPLGGQTVYIDANNSGALDTFATTYSNTTPVNIVDNAIRTSAIVVAGSNGPIFDVDVRLNITHTWDSDLLITLISPAGTRVILVNQAGDNGDNFVNTVLDDEATAAIGTGAAPFTGSFRPAQPLSVLDGVNANGTWTLEVSDLASGDTGVLQNWHLTITTAEQFALTRPNGGYGFLNLPIGTYTIRTVVPAGWTANPPSRYDLTITSPSDALRFNNFGLARNNRFYTQVFEDPNEDGIYDTTEGPIAGRVVFDDLNNNGLLDSFGTNTILNSTPLTVPDNSTVASTQVVSGLNGTITDINIRLNINMTWVPDLNVFLIHPDGTRVELFSAIGPPGGQNFTNTVLDDQAGTSIVDAAPPYTGSFRPVGLLSTLNGKTANGSWRLELTDTALGDSAIVNNWSMIIRTAENSITTGTAGAGGLDLTPGVHNVRMAAALGWRNTVPANGLHTVTAASAPLFYKIYGAIAVNIPPTVTVNSALSSGNEGTTITNSGTWFDPNLTDIVTLTASTGTIVKLPNGTWTWSLVTTDNISPTFVLITASDGFETASVNFLYRVDNVAPNLTGNDISISTTVGTLVSTTGTWSDVPADTVTMSASVGTVTVNPNGTWIWSHVPTTSTTVVITARDEDGGSRSISLALIAYAMIPTASVYYKGSSYSAAGNNVPAAMDPSKTVVRSGATTKTTSFANVSNYSRGINGVVLEVAGLNATSLTPLDFMFKLSPQGNFNEVAFPPSSWPLAPTPSLINVTPIGGGVSRVRIEWPDNAIENRWLQLRIRANANTGLLNQAVYYLGHLKGEINGSAVNSLLTVQNSDVLATSPIGGVGTVSNIRDVDKNGFILSSDVTIVRNSANVNASLRLITIPVEGSINEGSSSDSTSGGDLLNRGLVPVLPGVGVFSGGSFGSTGSTGSSGSTGSTGSSTSGSSSGTSGSLASSGSLGTFGSMGSSGSLGTSGTSDSTGSVGSSGAPAITGSSTPLPAGSGVGQSLGASKDVYSSVGMQSSKTGSSTAAVVGLSSSGLRSIGSTIITNAAPSPTKSLAKRGIEVDSYFEQLGM